MYEKKITRRLMALVLVMCMVVGEVSWNEFSTVYYIKYVTKE